MLRPGTIGFGIAVFAMVANAARLPIRVYSTADGLAQSTVHVIYRDSRGFLWVGTSEGISRYDGYEFRTYLEEGRPRQRRVRVFLETRGGELWAGTEDGVCRFSPGGAGERPLFDCLAPKVNVRLLADANDGSVWVGADEGLFRLDPRSRTLTATDVKQGIVWAVIRDQSDALWIATDHGLYWQVRGRPVVKFGQGDGLPSQRILALQVDGDGRLWAGTHDGLCLLVRSPAEGRPVVERMFTERDGLPANIIKVLHLGTQDALWIGTPAGAAEARRDGQGFSFRAYSVEHGLSHLDINTMEEDLAGNLWIGTESGGAMRLTRNGFVSYGTADGLGSAYVIGLLETRAGQVCAVSRRSGRLFLNFHEGELFRAEPVPVDASHYTPQFSGWYQVAVEAPEGQWWTASERGLLVWPPVRLLTSKDGLPGTHVYQVFRDSKGGVWVVTRDPERNGLARWDPATKRFHNFGPANGLPPMERNRPNGFGEDRHGQIWIGWWRTGVLRYANGRFDVFTTADGVPAGGIRRILEDSKGRLWIGSGGGGVGRIDDPTAKKLSIRTYSVEHGLSAVEVQALAEDSMGRIYVGTGHGVDRLDPETSNVRRFTALDGLAGGELQTAIRDRHGVMWFGSVQGLSRLVPAPARTRPAPNVFITGLRLNGRAMPVEHGAASKLELPRLRSGRDQVQFDFVAPRFTPGETIEYQWRLSPDSEWSTPADQRSVVYADFPSGSHAFEVRAISSDGQASSTVATVSLDISAPWWRRWWFALLCAAGLSAVVIAWHRYDLGRKLELEAIRMRIARDLHDEVGSGLSQIAILSEVAQRTTDRSPVAQIAELSRELVDAMGDIVWAINPARDNAADLAQRMHRFAADLVTSRDVALEFRTEGMDSVQAVGSEIRRHIYLIFRECLNNVVRHSRCTRVRISVSGEPSWLTLEIADDGVGFEERSAVNGNGLASLRQRAASVGGEIAWMNGSGTTVRLRVPLHKQVATKASTSS